MGAWATVALGLGGSRLGVRMDRTGRDGGVGGVGWHALFEVADALFEGGDVGQQGADDLLRCGALAGDHILGNEYAHAGKA